MEKYLNLSIKMDNQLHWRWIILWFLSIIMKSTLLATGNKLCHKQGCSLVFCSLFVCVRLWFGNSALFLDTILKSNFNFKIVQSNWFTQLAINKDGPKTSLELMQWNNVPEIDYQFFGMCLIGNKQWESVSMLVCFV